MAIIADVFFRTTLNHFLVTLVLVGSLAGCPARARDIYEHPNTYIGNAGWSGRLELWFEIGKLTLPGLPDLPLRLRFSSEPETRESLLGAGIWCPLLEGCSVDGGASFWFTLPGGGACTLNEGAVLQSKDHVFRGHRLGETMEVSAGAWKFRFASGRIVEARAGETTLHWNYENGHLSGISCGGKEWLKVIRLKGATRVQLPDGYFELSDRRSNGTREIRLRYPDGREETIVIAPEGEGVIAMRISSGWAMNRHYRWSLSTGKLLSDGNFSYEMREADIGRERLHRIDAKGRTEWYTFDMEKGLAIYKRQDGSRVQSWYHLEEGARHLKCFRMDTLNSAQALVSSRVLSIGPDGEAAAEWLETGPARLASEEGIGYISLGEAGRLHAEKGTVFVDARTMAEYDRGHIPGALRVARKAFESDYPHAEEALWRAGTIIVYCVSRQCEDSSIVAARLGRLGHGNIFIFEGGWAEWWKSGLERSAR